MITSKVQGLVSMALHVCPSTWRLRVGIWSNYICQILLAGLSVQLISFGFFCAVYVRSLYKVYTEEQDIWM